MRIDALAVRLRLSAAPESPDIGTRLCQAAAASVYRCFLVALLPVAALALTSAAWKPWLPALVLWWAKPWLDRSILFALSRAAFGQSTHWRDLRRDGRSVWFGSWWSTWTLRRLTASRASTQPIVQLEQLHGTALRRRLRQLRQGQLGVSRLLTSTYSVAEFAIVISLLTLTDWFRPIGESTLDLFTPGARSAATVAGTLAYAAAIVLVEPFYIAAGFGMYLNQRVRLEAWDVEQELRRAQAT